jgi:predicted  nucleic acid-binding Zn-ribbon protein
MEPVDLTLRILNEVRNDVRALKEQLDGHDARFDAIDRELAGRFDTLDRRFDAVDRRQTEADVRTATALAEVAGTLRDLHAMVRDRLELRDRVDRCERDIADLQHRVP